MVTLLGPRDEVLRTHRAPVPDVDIHVRGNEISVTGPVGDVALVERLVDELVDVIGAGQPLNRDAVERSVAMLRAQTAERPADVLTFNILSSRGRTIRPKTLNQKRYVDAIDEHTIVFGIGPAGTGKTYLAMAKAVQALQAKQVNRIVLTRPAVEAGERLGFLPGTLSDKIDPYLRPLYDALHDMLDPESIPRLMAAGTIEVAPLAYMRGRTLNDAFIILDEAQNTSAEQMKMFLTRLGFGSKMVVTGDVTQVDLPGGTRRGLRVVQEILDGRRRRALRRLTAVDVVRHRLVERHRRRVRPLGRDAAQRRCADARRLADAGRPAMSIEVNNESGHDVDEVELARARPLRAGADARAPAGGPVPAGRRGRHGRRCTCSGWTSPGPPTCCASRWTSCARAARARSPAGLLGDVVLCPRSRAKQARDAGHATEEELLLLTTHGILHLLGYDHAEPEEEKEMFALQRQLLLTFLADPWPADRLSRRGSRP